MHTGDGVCASVSVSEKERETERERERERKLLKAAKGTLLVASSIYYILHVNITQYNISLYIRYLQAIQARTWVPVKFNGQQFVANLPPETASSGPSFRDWGANSWWQNTRLTYWNMAVRDYL